MALANVADWLYGEGLRVVMIDWDLEAPGLENFFYESEDQLRAVRSQLGIIDLLEAYKRQFRHLPLPPPEKREIQHMLPVLQENLTPIQHSLYTVHAPGSETGSGALWLLPAGWRSADRFAEYARSVQSFDWEDLYRNYAGESFFAWLRADLLGDDLADVVLIDSRTGVTEMGGVCTRQLADVVVSFCAPNLQNISGTADMARSFQREELLPARNQRPLDMIIIPSRVEQGEGDKLNEFKENFLSTFKAFVPGKLEGGVGAFWKLRIPYIPYYAYRETLATRNANHPSAEELIPAYVALTKTMAHYAYFRSRTHPIVKVVERDTSDVAIGKSKVNSRLEDAASEWDANARHDSFLYRESPLAEAEKWSLSHKDELSSLAEDFLQASVALRDRERLTEMSRAKRFRIRAYAATAGGLATAVLAAISVGFYIQYQSARDTAEDLLGELLAGFLESCDAGDAEACNTAGVRIGDGEGAPVDFARSAALYVKACTLESGQGCRNAARRYRLGQGVAQDLPRAIVLYKESCSLGYTKGCEELEELQSPE